MQKIQTFTRASNSRKTFKFTQPSLTQQQFAGDADVNAIFERFVHTGDVSPFNMRQGAYGDYVTDLDYASALQATIDADEAFAELPAKIRARFHNNPGELLAWLGNGENYEEAVKLGIIAPRPDNGTSGVADKKASQEDLNQKPQAGETSA